MASSFTPTQLTLNLCCACRLKHVASVAQGIHAATVLLNQNEFSNGLLLAEALSFFFFNSMDFNSITKK